MFKRTVSYPADSLLSGLLHLRALRGGGHIDLTAISAPNRGVYTYFGKPGAAPGNVAGVANSLIVPNVDSALRGTVLTFSVIRVPNLAATYTYTLRAELQIGFGLIVVAPEA